MLLPPSNLHDRSWLPSLQHFQHHHLQTLQTALRGDMGRYYEGDDDDDDDESEDLDMNEEDDEAEEDDMEEEILEGLPHGNYVDVLVSTAISALEPTDQNNIPLNNINNISNIPNDFYPPTTSVFTTFANPYAVYAQQTSSPMVESVLDECHRQLSIIGRPDSLSSPFSGVDGVFAKFWEEFLQVVRNNPECHDRLIQFLGGFLTTVEVEGRNWFAPREKLGRGLLDRKLEYWNDEVLNEVREYLKGRDALDDSALDHPTVKHFVNYFSFLALLAKNFLDFGKWREIYQLPLACLEGRNHSESPCRDAALLAWERVIDLLGTRAYDELRDQGQGWMCWETKAGEIGLDFISPEPRRNTVKQTAERVHVKMRKLREEANTAIMSPFIFNTNSPFRGWPAVTCRAER
ncbi:hypothetical protein BJ508DRAFT_152894 [Ascobolus immersus RN42]|uniref:Uncharacterized protein n=1 Tax=Ascobolus immersus RN42 TaxID=1160509 RepID=A0A3N4HY74_ASCIM|nr:hypothetical protein BJ508DRAFT_152894 [Ascobolus immersus RN42]